MERLEQVRLAGAVWTYNQHQADVERELQPLIRTKVPKSDIGDDQALLNPPAESA
jgi:hypothetical protein